MFVFLVLYSAYAYCFMWAHWLLTGKISHTIGVARGWGWGLGPQCGVKTILNFSLPF